MLKLFFTLLSHISISTLILFSCGLKQSSHSTSEISKEESKLVIDDKAQYNNTIIIKPGAWRTNKYIPLLKNKNVAMVVNQTSTIGATHIVDSMLSLGVNIRTIFAPEHGFRGNHSAGAHVKSGKDTKTGLKITSLYGSHKKPTKEDLLNIDIIIFDIQDVGARFYTYLSTMHYVLEACAEQNKEVIILDRPNPNGYFVDGPILDEKQKSFVGMHPIPIVHGMTLGELAHMIVGEAWLRNDVKPNYKVIRVANYHHNMKYQLPIKPSPNLPNEASVLLYPSLCLFEGTNISVGRGTDKPFECFGRPGLKGRTYSFTPRSIPGIADNPPYKDKLCNGSLLTSFGLNYLPKTKALYLDWLLLCYEESKKENQKFFKPFFDKLAGTDQLRKDIIAGKTSKQIKQGWQKGLATFMKQRKPYLMYGFDENAGLIE